MEITAHQNPSLYILNPNLSFAKVFKNSSSNFPLASPFRLIKGVSYFRMVLLLPSASAETSIPMYSSTYMF